MARGKKRADGRREWKNQTPNFVSAVSVNGRGDAVGVTVDPGETVWLNAEEEELTAKAPKQAEKNPFLPQPFEVRDPQTNEVIEKGERPVFVLADEERYVPPRGSASEDEETDHPGVKTTARRRRGGTRAKASA